MNVTWKTKAYGRESDLMRLNDGRNNHRLPPRRRLGHDRSYKKIVEQLRDPIYCSLRECLIRATRANDELAVAKLELRIRDHLHEPREAFSNHKDY